MFIAKKQLIMIASILVIAILLISGVAVFLVYFADEEKPPEETKVMYTPDDRISPNLDQGLTLEINRMRHRGLLDKMLQRGRAWRADPQFYFITTIDDQEYVSKDVAAAGGASAEVYFADWDTMFQNRKIKRDAEEEQPTSQINVKIIEVVPVGLLGLRSEEVEQLNFDITYDYRTGRWEGDDSFNDSDGYGHVINENFEIWFDVVQNDLDHDGIPYWTEVNVLHTDPNVSDDRRDPDNDGIPTAWEWRWGYPHNISNNHTFLDPDRDGLENVEEYKMAKWFANPYQQDIYIESDGMQATSFIDKEHIFWQESQQILIERFCQHDINVYIDNGWPDTHLSNGGGEILPHYETISQDSGMMLEFYRNHFADERKEIFRYLVIGHNAGFCHPSEYNRYDTMAVGSSLEKALLRRSAFTPRTQRLVQAAGVMHELAHSLGIGPWNVGGNDNISFASGRAAEQEYLEKWGDYKSVNNYYYIWDKTIVDYSDGSHGPNDVNDWELFDLCYFQEESNVVEDPGFELPGDEEVD